MLTLLSSSKTNEEFLNTLGGWMKLSEQEGYQIVGRNGSKN